MSMAKQYRVRAEDENRDVLLLMTEDRGRAVKMFGVLLRNKGYARVTVELGEASFDLGTLDQMP